MVPEDPPDKIQDQLEDRYAGLLEEQAVLADEDTGMTQH